MCFSRILFISSKMSSLTFSLSLVLINYDVPWSCFLWFIKLCRFVGLWFSSSLGNFWSLFLQELLVYLPSPAWEDYSCKDIRRLKLFHTSLMSYAVFSVCFLSYMSSGSQVFISTMSYKLFYPLCLLS